MNPQTIQNVHDTQFSLTFCVWIESKVSNVRRGKRMLAGIRNLILLKMLVVCMNKSKIFKLSLHFGIKIENLYLMMTI